MIEAMLEATKVAQNEVHFHRQSQGDGLGSGEGDGLGSGDGNGPDRNRPANASSMILSIKGINCITSAFDFDPLKASLPLMPANNCTSLPLAHAQNEMHAVRMQKNGLLFLFLTLPEERRKHIGHQMSRQARKQSYRRKAGATKSKLGSLDAMPGPDTKPSRQPAKQ
eukprot:1193235-Pleurochrysis_carterae.AAC.2